MCTTGATSRARASAASRLDAVKASGGSNAERASSQTCFGFGLGFGLGFGFGFGLQLGLGLGLGVGVRGKGP